MESGVFDEKAVNVLNYNTKVLYYVLFHLIKCTIKEIIL